MADYSMVPKPVRRYAQGVTEHIGVEPAVERLTPKSWRVALAGRRVVAEAFFEFRNGTMKYRGGALTIDGEPAAPQSWDELSKTWAQTELAPQPASD